MNARAFSYRPLGHLGKHALRFKGNETLCIDLLQQLADAIEILHANGIQHRDIKPENILASSLDPLNIELADFGSADRSSMTVDVTNARGTLRYIAPEAAMGTYTKASDWYSVGLIVAELYTGVKIRSDEVTLYRAAEGKDRLPNTLAASPVLERIVKGLLDPDFRSRWQSQAVNHWLKAPAAERAVRKALAVKKVLVMLGVVALILVAAIALLSNLPDILRPVGNAFSTNPETEQLTSETPVQSLSGILGIVKWIGLIVSFIMLLAGMGRAMTSSNPDSAREGAFMAFVGVATGVGTSLLKAFFGV